MAEWNRWPVFTAQKRKHIPFKQPNPYGHQGNQIYIVTYKHTVDTSLILQKNQILQNVFFFLYP